MYVLKGRSEQLTYVRSYKRFYPSKTGACEGAEQLLIHLATL
jgi:hypothetical protein